MKPMNEKQMADRVRARDELSRTITDLEHIYGTAMLRAVLRDIERKLSERDAIESRKLFTRASG